MFAFRRSSRHQTISAVAIALVIWLVVLTSHGSGLFQSVEAKSANLLAYLKDGQSLPPRSVSYKWLVKREKADDDDDDDESTFGQDSEAEEPPQLSIGSSSKSMTSDGKQEQQPTKEPAEDTSGLSDTSASEEQQFEPPDENLEHEEQPEGEQTDEPEDLSDVKTTSATIGNSVDELTSVANASTTTATTEVPKAAKAKVEVEQKEPAQQQNVLQSGPLESIGELNNSTSTLSSAGTATQESPQEQLKAVVQQVGQSEKILEAGPTQADQTERAATAIEPISTDPADSTKPPAKKMVVPEDFVSPSIKKIAELPKLNTTQEQPVQSKEDNRVDLAPPTADSAPDSRSASSEHPEIDNPPSVVGATSPPPAGYSTELPTTTSVPSSTSTEVSGANSFGEPKQSTVTIKQPGAVAEPSAEFREDQMEELSGSVAPKAPPSEEAKPTPPLSQVAAAVKAGTQADQQHESEEPKQAANSSPPPSSKESAGAAVAAAATTQSRLPSSQQLDSNTIRQEPSLESAKNFETSPDEVVVAPEPPTYKLDLASCSSYSTSNSSETQLRQAVESILNTLTSYECRQVSSRHLKLDPLVNKQIHGQVLEASALPLETGQFTEAQLNRVSCLPNDQVSSAKAIRLRLDQEFDDQYLLARWRLYQRLQQDDLPAEVFKSLARSKLNQVPQHHLQRSVVTSNKCQRFQVETGDYYLELLSLSTSSIYEVELSLVGGTGSVSSNGNESSLLNESVLKVRLLDIKACSLYLDHGLVKAPLAALRRSSSANQLLDQQRQQTIQVLHANNNHFRRSNWLLDHYGNWLKHEYRRQLRVLFNGGQLRDQLSLCFTTRGN